MKRFCQILKLPKDKNLIREYCELHSKVWTDVQKRLRDAGVLDMQIYQSGTSLFMIMDTSDDFDWEREMSKLTRMSRKTEWEAYFASLQGIDPNAKLKDKWRPMNQIFKLETVGQGHGTPSQF